MLNAQDSKGGTALSLLAWKQDGKVWLGHRQCLAKDSLVDVTGKDKEFVVNLYGAPDLVDSNKDGSFSYSYMINLIVLGKPDEKHLRKVLKRSLYSDQMTIKFDTNGIAKVELHTQSDQ